MKAFFIGLVALAIVGIFAGIGFLLHPFFILLGFLLRFFAWLAFIILCVWILGKFIIFIWDKAFKKGGR